MKKEWALLIITVIVTLLIAIIFMRLFAPQLLGIPFSLQLVQVSKKVPPFYEGIFRAEDSNSKEFQLNDPYTEVRSKPLIPEFWGLEVVGPHDILGFRNKSVPNIADVIVIGDSQTYGNNAVFEDNWPSQLSRTLGKSTVYSMAAGGWGAVQYLDMFTKAILFQPQLVIVAFYTGNDPLESFVLAYNVDKWKSLRVDPNLSAKDVPSVKFPPPQSEWWHVKFKDGIETFFTPQLRLASNQEHPAVYAGYNIMRDVAQQISMKTRTSNVQVVFTIIPTKELVYAEKVLHGELIPPESYLALISSEEKNLKNLAAELAKLPNAIYVDILTPLQQAALKPIQLYPADINGHPIAAGYKVIAEALSSITDSSLHDKPQGLFAVELSSKDNFIALINNEGVWVFDRDEMIIANGWPLEDIRAIKYRDIANLPIRGVVTSIDPARFGPASVRVQ